MPAARARRTESSSSASSPPTTIIGTDVAATIQDLKNSTDGDISIALMAAYGVSLDDIKQRTRNRTIAPEEMRDYTFTLSNFGTLAGRYATPLVVPPS